MLGALLLGAATAIACSHDPTNMAAQPGRPLLSLMTSCGVSYRATVIGSDQDLEQYGVKPDTEVTDVCETWTGSDYQVQMTRVYSNSPEAEAPDAAATVVYMSGAVEGYGGAGDLQDTDGVGATSFEYVNATSAEMQASYDDPYYGTGGGSAGCFPDCQMAPSLPKAGRVDVQDSLGLRHALTRRGIRYLVNDLDEIAAGPTGNRRFHGQRGNMEVTLELAPLTELLVAEEYQSATVRLRANHVWVPMGGRWVRSRSDYDGEFLGADGAWAHSRTIVTLSDFQVGTP